MIEFPNEESKWTWLAGLIDCDSSITLNKSPSKTAKRGYSLKSALFFEQTNEELANEFKKVATANSKIFSPRYKHGSPTWRVCLYAEKLRILLPKISPFLIKKKEQAKLLLDALSLIKQHSSGHTPNDKPLLEIYHKLRSLHEKGKHKGGNKK